MNKTEFKLHSTLLKAAMRMKLYAGKSQYQTLSFQGEYAFFTDTTFCMAIPHLNYGWKPEQKEGININLNFSKPQKSVLNSTEGLLQIEHTPEKIMINTSDDIQITQKNLNVDAIHYLDFIEDIDKIMKTEKAAETPLINTFYLAELNTYQKILTGDKNTQTFIKVRSKTEPIIFSFELPESYQPIYSQRSEETSDIMPNNFRTCYFMLMPMRQR